MNREDIIRTAKEAGFVRVGRTWVCEPDEIEAFAVLVVSAERTWVGLTNEELQYCIKLKNPIAIAEEIEAKLRSKNT